LILAGGGPVAALLAITAARSVEIAFYWIGLPIPPAGEGAGGNLRQMAGPTLVQAVSLQLFFRVDILLLGAMGAASGAIGWYAAAQQVAVIAPLVAGVVAPMATVALARGTGSKDIATLDRRTDHISCLGLILFIASAGVAPLLAPLLFGPEFAPAAPLFAWLALGGAGTWLSAMGSGRWAAAGQVRWPAAVSLAALLVAVPAHVLSIPAFGALGAAIVTATTGALAGTVMHLSAPGHSSRRVLETLAALGLGAIAAVAAHGGLSGALSWLGWAA
jgi:O-antigen/teichoic acid export membrane protein